ncbi:multiple sugar transport system permease protein [Rhizobium sp. PP-WC-2G-219]|uniref:Carbohydrate ABC transporter permease n=1 Tax=Ferranicluibacter rubi TaxID=2715133 RepID=A0AA44CB71_9HYPH|nr:carbohydrate ABC transporter permease [Ferranicluibacter rubi]PYE32228.1 multiple sugar transport system permease protein [Rhizobium sp. PP-WC-1G-195]PYE43519.1 multiple sugar transport system permease protein [Rhizobium sp. PP-F2F-G20b]TCL92283.1 multiple sugar transport system permease protein [Rhizobium sp. PP-WC-2G-219]TCP82113.1 multiple sugar transport system permease protein [Rhizobium sp. PP-CC-2G-626]TCQ25898.1 multiple sugar transport system permease protein [Rhizobium sp. PP-CC-3
MMKTLRWIVFVIAVLAMNFPIIVTLVTSFKSARELSVNPGLWIGQPTIENYLRILTQTDRFNIYAYLWNSTVAALIGTGLAILLAFPAAYAIAKSDVGRRTLLPIVINLRAVPLIIFAIPLYMMYQWLGLLDTQLGLGLILTIVNIPLALVILVDAISDVPLELDEAARMDGASSWQIMTRIIRPVVRPALVTTFIFGFITAWNEFLFGLMLTTSRAVPATVGASFFFAASGGGVQWGTASAVMVLGALPPVLLGLVMYRQISGSMMAGAVKG